MTRAVRLRLPTLVVLLPLCVVGALSTGTGNAQAAGYRYWSFWESDGGDWTYATQGPATARPADGTVTGFRFSVSEDSGDAARPRRAPDFAAICGGTPQQAGGKRVAVVVDPGTAADAPAGERPPPLRARCARLGEDATAAEALAAVAKPLRYSGEALLCAISGYPASGCGEQVTGRTPVTSTATPPELPGTATTDGGATDGSTTDSGAADGGAADGGATGGGMADGGTSGSGTADDGTADDGTPRGGSADRADGGDGADGGGGPAVGLLGGAAAVLALVVAGRRRQARRRRG